MSDFADDKEASDDSAKCSSERESHARVTLTSENSREETIRRMRAFPERSAKFRELIRSPEKRARTKSSAALPPHIPERLRLSGSIDGWRRLRLPFEA